MLRTQKFCEQVLLLLADWTRASVKPANSRLYYPLFACLFRGSAFLALVATNVRG
jgi:hypothetical protein